MMNILLFSLSTGMVWGLIVGVLIMLPILFMFVCYYILAPNNIFFTFGRENRSLYVMIGKRFTGKVILPSKTIYIDKGDKYLIKKFEDLPADERTKFTQTSLFGMHWIGIYPFFSLHERHQQWLEWKSTSGGGREISLRDENTLYLFCKPFEYAMFAEEAEDINGVPLNVFFTVTLMPTSATLPIFGNDNAYGQVQTKCLSEVLLFIKKKTFANLGGDNTTPVVTNDEFSLLLRSLNTQIPGSPRGDGIVKILGYEITDAKLDKVEVAGPKKAELLEASTMAYVAGEQKKKKVLLAEGERDSDIIIAQGIEAKLNVQREYLRQISEIPGAMKVEERKATPGLTTLVEAGSGKKTNVSKLI